MQQKTFEATIRRAGNAAESAEITIPKAIMEYEGLKFDDIILVSIEKKGDTNGQSKEA